MVVDLDFCVLNYLRDEVQQNPVEPGEEDDCYLYTIYEVAVIRTYKGNTTLIEEIYLLGGEPDQKKEEQKQNLCTLQEEKLRDRKIWNASNFVSVR